MTRFLLLLGSNLDRERSLAAAEAALGRRFDVLARSRVYESEAVGDPSGPPFLNRAVLLRAAMGAEALLEALRGIEASLGRVRGPDRNSPRTIDVDLLLASTEEGVVLPAPPPHRDLARLHHAVLPAAEIAGELVLPGGRDLAAIAASLGPPPPGFRIVG